MPDLNDEEAWKLDALCAQIGIRDDLFFPKKGENGKGAISELQKLCPTCDVQKQCLVYALKNDIQYGSWGGLSGKQRKELSKKKKSEILNS